MIVLTGVTGGLGRATLEHLLLRVPRDQVVVTARDLQKVRNLTDSGIETRQCDYDNPASIRAAFTGASRIHLIPSHEANDRRLQQNMTVIDIVAEMGVSHIFYASQAHAAFDAPLGVYRVHAYTEAYLRESGLTWTMLRNGYYMEDVVPYVGSALRTGVIAKPLDGPIPYVSRREYGEAHAVLLAKGCGGGETFNLTNTRAWDLTDVINLMSRLLGREFRREILDDAAFEMQLRARGVSEEWVVWQGEGFKQSRNNGVAATWPTLGELLGRDPASLETRLTDLLAQASIARIESHGLRARPPQ